MEITNGIHIKSVLSKMSNMGIISDSTGNSYEKVKNMWSGFSDDTGAFPKLNNMERNDIKNTTGMKLATSINVFSNWILSQSKTLLGGKKKLRWSPNFMSRIIGKFYVMPERKKIFVSQKDTEGSEAQNLAEGFEESSRDKGASLLCSEEVKYPKMIKVLTLGLI